MKRVNDLYLSDSKEAVPGFSTSEIKQYKYCKQTGMISNDLCEILDEAEIGYYIASDEPRDYCKMHQE